MDAADLEEGEEVVAAGDGVSVGANGAGSAEQEGHTTPPATAANSGRRPPRPPATAASSAPPTRPRGADIDVDDADDEPAVDPALRYRVEMLVRNHKASWIQTQKRGPEWAFYVPRDPTPHDLDEMSYRGGDLHVDCFICHASKTGDLHAQFPTAPDQETRMQDEYASFWAAAPPRTRDNTEAKHSMNYKSKNGNNSLKKHIDKHHAEEFQQVRRFVVLLLLLCVHRNSCMLQNIYEPCVPTVPHR